MLGTINNWWLLSSNRLIYFFTLSIYFTVSIDMSITYLKLKYKYLANIICQVYTILTFWITKRKKSRLWWNWRCRQENRKILEILLLLTLPLTSPPYKYTYFVCVFELCIRNKIAFYPGLAFTVNLCKTCSGLNMQHHDTNSIPPTAFAKDID